MKAVIFLALLGVAVSVPPPNPPTIVNADMKSFVYTQTNCKSPTYTLDFTDCRKFTYCKGDSYNYQFECKPGFAFNQKTNNCDLESPNFVCQNVAEDCNSVDRPAKVPNRNDPKSYYICENPIQMGTCPDKYYFGSAGYCQFFCEKEGKYPNSADPENKSYFDCVKIGETSIAANFETCPENNVFDVKTSKCVKK